MRAHEFISEAKGKPSKRQRYATVGLHTFTDSNYDRTYLLNRVMMATASTDGTFVPKIEQNGWSSKMNTAHPYTKQEHDMLKMAYQAAGAPLVDDLNDGDLKSDELDSTNYTSPIKPFKGYKR